MKKINYNEMLMMLWNQSPTVAAIGDWGNWTNQEKKLFDSLLKTEELEKAIILISDNYNIENTISDNIVLKYASDHDIKLINWNCMKGFERSYQKIKNDLNIRKIIVKSNQSDLNLIIEAFGKENVIVIDVEAQDLNDLNLKAMKEALLTGDLEQYKKLSGGNFTFTGHVVKGKQIGRQIGFPTANINTEHKLKIIQGVYWVKVTLPNEDFFRWGIASFRDNTDGVEVFETNILDFNKDIYGWRMEVELVKFIRPNTKVNSLDELKELIEADKNNALEFIKNYK
ncbi:riboflavin kinase [Mesoplasma photuris]|uniref:riboflavin kinase n=1 Tax=Mesoplasma photuris TaxID=217731 RepID=UPI000689348C|nr:riboflavin kinase [Mesoplasma photuris]